MRWHFRLVTTVKEALSRLAHLLRELSPVEVVEDPLRVPARGDSRVTSIAARSDVGRGRKRENASEKARASGQTRNALSIESLVALCVRASPARCGAPVSERGGEHLRRKAGALLLDHVERLEHLVRGGRVLGVAQERGKVGRLDIVNHRACEKSRAAVFDAGPSPEFRFLLKLVKILVNFDHRWLERTRSVAFQNTMDRPNRTRSGRGTALSPKPNENLVGDDPSFFFLSFSGVCGLIARREPSPCSHGQSDCLPSRLAVRPSATPRGESTPK